MAGGTVMKIARRGLVPSFIVMEVMRAAAKREAKGATVLHMEVGQPGTPAPETAREAARQALERYGLGYTLALGIDGLRQRIAQHYEDAYGVKVAADRVVITSGSSAGFVLAFLALFDPGDRVALPSPGYPCYRHILTALGQQVSLLETGPDDRWMPRVELIREHHGVAPLSGLVLASPANPTGTIISKDRLAEIIDYCGANAIAFISDEIYHGLNYEGPAPTALAVSDDVVVVNSFSKYYSMTGWRIGWLVVPTKLVPVIEKLAQNFYISPPSISQHAAVAAFDGRDELEKNVAVYARNRARLIEALPGLGLSTFAPPDGAFYIYINVRHLTDDSEAFARQMLDETGVAATPGVDFDARRGTGFLRLCYAASEGDIDEAIARLSCWGPLKVR